MTDLQKKKNYNKKWWKQQSHSQKGLSKAIYRGQQTSSKLRGHNIPDYTLEEFREWLFSQPNFDKLYRAWEKAEYIKGLKPSADRLNDNLGYSFNNMQLITWDENRKKQREKELVEGKAHSRRVDRVSIESGKILETYPSISIGGRWLNGKADSLKNVLSPKRKCNILQGYRWQFTKESQDGT